MTRKIQLWGKRGRENGIAGGRETQSSSTIAKRERTVVSAKYFVCVSPQTERCVCRSTPLNLFFRCECAEQGWRLTTVLSLCCNNAALLIFPQAQDAVLSPFPPHKQNFPYHLLMLEPKFDSDSPRLWCMGFNISFSRHVQKRSLNFPHKHPKVTKKNPKRPNYKILFHTYLFG